MAYSCAISWGKGQVACKGGRQCSFPCEAFFVSFSAVKTGLWCTQLSRITELVFSGRLPGFYIKQVFLINAGIEVTGCICNEVYPKRTLALTSPPQPARIRKAAGTKPGAGPPLALLTACKPCVPCLPTTQELLLIPTKPGWCRFIGNFPTSFPSVSGRT